MNGPKERLWTVMVYMVGDECLDNNGFADLKEMKRIGSTKEVAIIAQFCRGLKNRPTKRYHFRKTGRNGPLANDVVENLGEIRPSDPKALEDFIRWGSEKFPAKRYLVVIWGHGNGADDENTPNAANNTSSFDNGASNLNAETQKSGKTSKSITISPAATAYEGNAVDFLDTCGFKKSLESATVALGRKIDVLGMDACLMSGAEVCYQLRDSVRFTVAPEGKGPLDGWPYEKILAELVKKPAMKPEELSCTIIEKYLASYADYEDVSITHSVCDLGKSDTLAGAIDRLAESLLNNLSDKEIRKAIMLSRWQAQSYDGTSYVDLYDFCDLLRNNCNHEDIKLACRGVMRTIGPAGFVLKSVYQGEAAQYSYGLSIYFPLDEVSRFYERLEFAKSTRWVEFLKRYLRKTRRPGRKRRSGSAGVW